MLILKDIVSYYSMYLYWSEYTLWNVQYDLRNGLGDDTKVFKSSGTQLYCETENSSSFKE